MQTPVVGEVLCKVGARQLFFQNVDLVEEENDRGLGEPPLVADGLEQIQALDHAVLHSA